MDGDMLAGSSSFGMSGVNAHVLLQTSQQPAVAAKNEALVWQRSRLYALPHRQAMCTTAARSGTQQVEIQHPNE
jgi:acyl transferase domain-containing protein